MKKPLIALVLVTALVALIAQSCSSTPARRDVTGEAFPQVTGTSLEGDKFAIPGDLNGEPAVLLIGYLMESQFDIDRWILGLVQAETPVRIIEVPTIPGMFPGMFAGSIDEGMRGGIPSEDWGSVVTVYGDGAGEIKRWTGAGDRNGRVMLLDAEGVVRWFHDEGYSAGKLTELDAALRELK